MGQIATPKPVIHKAQQVSDDLINTALRSCPSGRRRIPEARRRYRRLKQPEKRRHSDDSKIKMGQAESHEEAHADPGPEPVTQSSSASDTQTMESLISEAMAYKRDETESLDARVEIALECPCVADLRSGSCGVAFTEAFRCFLKSTAEEKGSDCVAPFIQLQKCIEANPKAFSKDVLGGDEDTKKTKLEEEYKIIPPLWSVDRPQNRRSKI